MFGHESTVDEDYARYCGPDRCPFCGQEMDREHNSRECERDFHEEDEMPIWAKREQSDYRPAPEGLHQGVCVDVIDLGLLDTPFGKKHKARFRWQLESRDPETGKRYLIQKDYTLSLHDQANLTKDLESWRGKKFTATELAGFDLEVVLGANCQIQVVHNTTKEGKTWANVQTIVPINSKMVKIQAEDYTRENERTNGHDEEAAVEKPYEATIDEVPF